MKIVDVEVCRLDPPPPSEKGTLPRREPWTRTFKQATPMSKFEPPIGRREPGGLIWVKVIAEDGTYGLGSTDTGDVAAVLIRESLSHIVIGQEVGANDLYGQHWTFAMPNVHLIEMIQFSAPGVPMEECYLGSPSESGRLCYRSTPGTPMPVNGRLGLPPGPGFGL